VTLWSISEEAFLIKNYSFLKRNELSFKLDRSWQALKYVIGCMKIAQYT
jgi:hypothetical protein